MLTRRIERILLALALGLLVVGWVLRDNEQGTAHTIGRVLVPLGGLCAIVAGISSARRAKRENNRLRATLLGSDTAPGTDERPDRHGGEEDSPSR
ncbi:hypothetical protein DLJ59_17590 [Micromonospora inaquosa]|uniref:Uncharacterized protein n=2 Tax=Micromonospora inaquosa TaxID=2203716 RepID=A0A3N9WLM1_9ACTN|nr:hypothetical protein DLJ59_17590 [Micromonospora inaquosa]